MEAPQSDALLTMRTFLRYVNSSDDTRIEMLVFERAYVNDEEKRQTSGATCAVLAHAHPKLGATRDMMVGLARALCDRDVTCAIVSARGTDGSAGTSSWRGSDEEAEDVKACARELARVVGARACHCVGYSFGATIVGNAIDRDDVMVSFIGVGYPRGSYSCGLMGVGAKMLMRDAFEALRRSAKPKLFIHPERDEFTSVETMERLVREKMSSEVEGDGVGRVELKILRDVGHFSALSDARAVDEMAAMIVEFIQSLTARDDDKNASASAGAGAGADEREGNENEN